jgi:aerobic carbon-monoxide dehydrogenase medium subunit
MKPAAFAYHRPRSLDEALMLLAEHGDEAKPLAGGQSLIPAMNFRLATPAVLIDLNEIPELQFIKVDEQVITIGGMTRHRAVEHDEDIGRLVPLLHDTMPFVAHPAVRTRGTIGGSLAHADPAAELPAVMIALDAHLGLRGRSGARRVPAREFFTGLFSTALGPGELVVDVEINARPNDQGVARGWAFEEISRRRGDFALVGVAAVVDFDDGGRCSDARIVLLSVGDRPIVAEHAARDLVGEVPTAAVIRAAAESAARQDIDPTSDIHASSRYRRHLASVLTRRTVERAFARATT